MKKLFAIFLISLVTAFTICPMAAAADPPFSGTYEMVATGICNHSTLGWIDAKGVLNGPVQPWTPAKHSKIWAANATIQATVQFNAGGTGSLAGVNYISLLPGGECPVSGIKEYQVSASPVGAEFTYEITNEVEITITTISKNPSIVPTIMTGVISRDRKVINLVNANQILNLTGTPYQSYAIQNLIRILVRMSN